MNNFFSKHFVNNSARAKLNFHIIFLDDISISIMAIMANAICKTGAKIKGKFLCKEAKIQG